MQSLVHLKRLLWNNVYKQSMEVKTFIELDTWRLLPKSHMVVYYNNLWKYVHKPIALMLMIHIWSQHYINDNSSQCDKRHQNSHHIFHMSPDSFVVDFFSIVIADLPNYLRSSAVCKTRSSKSWIHILIFLVKYLKNLSELYAKVIACSF